MEKPMMIQRSVDNLLQRSGWVLDDSTFQILNEKRVLWSGKVTTQDGVYTVLVSGATCIAMIDEDVAALRNYLNR